MSSTIYNKAFEMELSHDFYVAANKFLVNRQLDIAPTEECVELMSRGRMRAVRTQSGLDVFFKAYKDSSTMVPVIKPLVQLSGEMTFMFVVRIKDAAGEFLNITDLNQGGTYNSGSILFLDKSLPPSMPPPSTTPLSVNLAASLFSQLRPSVFTYTFLPDTPALQDDLVINVYPENSVTSVLTVDPVLVNPATGIYSAEIDLSKQPKGIYTITATNPSDGDAVEHTAVIYVDTALASEKVFALIRIKYTNPNYFYQGLPDTISYAFVNREVIWRYYIVAQNLGSGFFDTFDLTVFDENPSGVTFEASKTSPSPDGQPYGQPDDDIQINGFPTVILTSLSEIAYTEEPRLHMNLFKHLIGSGLVTPDDTRIVENLPNARADGVDTDQLGSAQVPPTITNGIAEIFVIV